MNGVGVGREPTVIDNFGHNRRSRVGDYSVRACLRPLESSSVDCARGDVVSLFVNKRDARAGVMGCAADVEPRGQVVQARGGPDAILIGVDAGLRVNCAPRTVEPVQFRGILTVVSDNGSLRRRGVGGEAIESAVVRSQEHSAGGTDRAR